MPKKATMSVNKVAPKKVAAKKSAPKKAATKKVSKAAAATLVYAPNEQSFWVTDGQVLNSLLALKEALAEMEKAVYSHHVSAEKNDFADWVEAVLCDMECALELRKAKTPKSAHTVVAKRLKVYQA
jgi:hypothetical protein